MSLSVKKDASFLAELGAKEPLRIQLNEAAALHADGVKTPFEMDRIPILLFLRAVGFESISLHFTEQANRSDSIETWLKRMAEYEQIYIQDPENLILEECVWNEMDHQSATVQIECVLSSSSTQRRENLQALPFLPPPLAAPLRVDEDARQKFIAEVENQPARDTLLRIQSILKEFRAGTRGKDEDDELWGALLSDIVSVALEANLVEKAVQITKEYEADLRFVWREPQRVERIFSSYDPKSHEVELWANLYESLGTKELIQILESSLSSPAGPQILKLIQFRAQRVPEQFIEIAMTSSSKSELPKLILPLLLPCWRLKHYPVIYAHFLRAIEKGASEAELKLWIQALQKSSLSQACRDFEAYFKKKKFFWSREFPHIQRAILEALEESPSSETILFLKKVKPMVRGVLSDKIDKILSFYSRGDGKTR